ncbi:helix-turn-helix transcriptional regulator [Nocardia sp. NPDC052254]|uniref:helix-turn-helix domain-containing protein n=1 Tax=Nocardia sp. NPDC052254 TaxID=3155681 RepID=UPI003426FEA9
MGRTMELGSGPAADGPGSGISGVDRVIGPFISGENVAWGFESGSAVALRDLITSAAGRDVEVLDLDSLDRMSQDVTGTFVVDLSEVDAELLEPPWSGRLGECARTVFRSGAVCHWLVSRQVLDAAPWAWSMQCVFGLDENDMTILRADGRRTARARIALAPQASVGGRRSSMNAAHLGAGLRHARIEKGWSQTELGRRAGVSASAISQMERGRLGLSLETALEVAGQLGVALDDLLRGGVDFIVVEQRPGISAQFAPPRTRSARELVSKDSARGYVLGAGGTLNPPIGSSGHVTLMIGSGFVQVDRLPQRTLARSGDILAVERATGVSVSNLGSEDAVLFCL